MTMLCPAGGWLMYGEVFDGISWLDDRPRCTKEQFEAGFAQYDSWQAQQEANKATAKLTAEAKLAALGLSADDLKALGL